MELICNVGDIYICIYVSNSVHFPKVLLLQHELDYVWQVDRVTDPQKIKLEVERREDIVCISALTGEGLLEFCNAVQEKLKVFN